jgi:hypothetical protein
VVIERRQKRSACLKEAMMFYLEALAIRAQLQTMALATHDGMLVAGAAAETPAPDSAQLEYLAALGAAQGRGIPGAAPLLAEMTAGTELYTLEVNLEGQTFYLAGVSQRDQPEVLEPLPLPEGSVEDDLRRILGES